MKIQDIILNYIPRGLEHELIPEMFPGDRDIDFGDIKTADLSYLKTDTDWFRVEKIKVLMASHLFQKNDAKKELLKEKLWEYLDSRMDEAIDEREMEMEDPYGMLNSHLKGNLYHAICSIVYCLEEDAWLDIWQIMIEVEDGEKRKANKEIRG